MDMPGQDSRFDVDDAPGFERKCQENYESACVLCGREFYNAAATRIFYSLLHLALRRMSLNECEREYYLTYDELRKQYKIDKSKVRNRARDIGIREFRSFVQLFQDAQGNRNKAEYFSEDVLPEDLGDSLLDLQNLIRSEGFSSTYANRQSR